MPASDLPDPQREILNLDEAAAYLGVSTKTFQKVLREGEMPGRKVGREWKFSRRALEAWIGAGKSAEFLDLEDEVEAAPAAASAATVPVEARNGTPAKALAAAAGANGGAPPGPRAAPARSRHGPGAFEAEED